MWGVSVWIAYVEMKMVGRMRREEKSRSQFVWVGVGMHDATSYLLYFSRSAPRVIQGLRARIYIDSHKDLPFSHHRRILGVIKVV